MYRDDEYSLQVIKSILRLNEASTIQEAHSAFSVVVFNAKYLLLEKYGDITDKDVSELREFMHDLVQALGGL